MTVNAVDRALARERERFLSGRGEPRVREEIHSSWRRCSSWSVPAGDLTPPYRPDVNPEAQLLRAARPVLDWLNERLGELGVGFIVTDTQARILDRRASEPGLLRSLDDLNAGPGFVFAEDAVGTNGLGTAVELGRTIRVDGHEHYADALTRFTCVGVPIVDPVARHPVGVLDVTSAADRENPAITLLAEQTARCIEQCLYGQHSEIERSLLARFLSASRRSRSGIIVLNDRMVLTNAAAVRLLDGVEQPVLIEHAAGVAARPDTAPIEGELTAADGSVVRTRTLPLREAGDVLGAIVELSSDDQAPRRPHPAPPAPPPAPPHGLVGQDRAFRWACRAARSALTSRPVVLRGEPGTGKLALALALQREHDDEPVVRDAAHAGDEPDLWLVELRAVLSGPPGGAVLRHADLVPTGSRRRLAAVLAHAAGRGWRCALTVTGGSSSDTNPDPTDLLLSGLEVDQVTVPPLRDRLRDVPALVAAFAKPRRIAPEAVRLLARLCWPGNVRELRSAVRHALDAAPDTTPGIGDLPADVRRAAPRRALSRFEQAEVHAILDALAETGGHKRDAAALLGISRSTLYRKLQAAGIDLSNRVY